MVPMSLKELKGLLEQLERFTAEREDTDGEECLIDACDELRKVISDNELSDKRRMV